MHDDEIISLAQFLRQARRRDPQRYREICRRYPVNLNVRRDELSREVPENPDELDRRSYRDWISQAWD